MSTNELKEQANKVLECELFPLNSLKDYKYATICSFYNGDYLFSKHKNRSTWEMQGGHIESGETPLQAAKRELFEETGATDYELIPIFDYCGYTKTERSNGVLFLAIIHTLGELPGYEMERVKTFKKYPKNLTYPLVTPIMFKNAKKYLK
jgi:8-oxo-dGTP diphosphatase